MHTTYTIRLKPWITFLCIIYTVPTYSVNFGRFVLGGLSPIPHVHSRCSANVSRINLRLCCVLLLQREWFKNITNNRKTWNCSHRFVTLGFFRVYVFDYHFLITLYDLKSELRARLLHRIENIISVFVRVISPPPLSPSPAGTNKLYLYMYIKLSE